MGTHLTIKDMLTVMLPTKTTWIGIDNNGSDADIVD